MKRTKKLRREKKRLKEAGLACPGNDLPVLAGLATNGRSEKQDKPKGPCELEIK